MELKKVWFITGASKGLGLSLVKQLLVDGQFVAGTSRNLAELISAVGQPVSNFLPLQVNLADQNSVGLAIQETNEKFGKIDVVINNAGYGIGGSIEELSDAEVRANFDVNVFGMINVIRKVLPLMREQKSGHIINISSIAGITANTGWAVYGASKYAVVGLSEVLAEDVRSFGIKVTVVAPGAFRTNFLTPEALVMTKNPIAAYEDVRTSHEKYLKMDGNQAGDPEKAAAAMIQIANEINPPLYLLLGEDAYQRALAKIGRMESEFNAWKDLTVSTGFTEIDA